MAGGYVYMVTNRRNGTLYVVDSAVEAPFKPSTEVTIGFRDRGIAIIGG